MGPEPEARRVPIQRDVDLRFPNFEGLVTGVSANLSTTGMFIRSHDPPAAGAEFTFALRIEEWSPIQGRAKVVWARPVSEGPERPAGMGVRFLDVDAQSRRMIRWLVDKHVEGGGKPFDLQTVPAGASKYGGKASGSRRSAGRAEGPGRHAADPTQGSKPRSRNRLGLGILAVVMVLAVGFVVYRLGFETRSTSSRPARSGSIAADGRIRGSDAIDSSSPGESIRAEVDGLNEVSRAEVISTIQSWADAWEARDYDAIIAHYTEEFVVTSRGGRGPWADDLRRQLGDLEFVRVAISGLEISLPTPTTARATFFRSFRSNRGDSSERLQLELIYIEDGWKIQAEQILE